LSCYYKLQMPKKQQFNIAPNPFIDEMEINVRKIKRKDKRIKDGHVDPNTGLVADTFIEGDDIYVDTTPFIKSLKTEATKELYGLSKSSSSLLKYIELNLGADEDLIVLDPKVIAKSNIEALKIASIYKALKDLTERKLILETEIAGMYYINPSCIFNGNRIKLKRNHDYKKIGNKTYGRIDNNRKGS